ncbi:MAG TPA: CocE/NonD family hydrolase [Xanthobacteraceae bacterium]|jgi:dienelactone hydrolase|nr:CocE/NonD family hydrolase [Xanthobacteraceae bacterium]
MRWRFAILLAASLMTSAKVSMADPFTLQTFRVLLGSDLGTLEAFLVRPSEPGRYPLVVLAHGSPRSAADRPAMTPLAMLPEAMEFASRGWAAAVVMRRGYGNSDGGWAETYGSCDNPNYVTAGAAGAADLKLALEFLSHRQDIDPMRLMAVGVSAGGFATVALTVDPPPGLVAAISFAGGRGSLEADKDCRSDKLVEAFRTFGQRSRVPMLWVYAANDHFFGPALAQQLADAFKSGGGKLDFVAASSFGSDGHGLFSPSGIPVWTGYVDTFLKKQNLVLRADPIPVPRPPLTPPSALSANGRKAFESYLISGPHKAFAVSPDGAFGWKTGMRTAEAASAAALKFCQQNAAHCDVMFVDDAAR